MKENADYLKEQKGKYVGLKFAFWLVLLKYAVLCNFHAGYPFVIFQKRKQE